MTAVSWLGEGTCSRTYHSDPWWGVTCSRDESPNPWWGEQACSSPTKSLGRSEENHDKTKPISATPQSVLKPNVQFVTPNALSKTPQSDLKPTVQLVNTDAFSKTPRSDLSMIHFPRHRKTRLSPNGRVL